MKINKLMNILILLIAMIGSLFIGEQISANSEQLIIVNKKNNTLYFYENGKQTKSFKVATGKSSTPTPTGTFKVNVKWKCPIYYATNARGCASGNPLGTRWIGLSVPGTNGYTYGIHGTNKPSSIGTYASNGCVRSPKAELEWLFNKVKMNTKVVIINSSKSADTIAKEKGYVLEKTTNKETVKKPVVKEPTKQHTNTTGTKNENTYIVKAGDTLNKIAKEKKVTVKELREWNGIKGDLISVKQKLKVTKPQNTTVVEKKEEKPIAKPTQKPIVKEENKKEEIKKDEKTKAKQHTVKKGETLYRIAKNHNVSVANLKSWNKLKSDNININQELYVQKP